MRINVFNNAKHIGGFYFSICCALFIAGCSASLSPRYDQKIVDQLSLGMLQTFELLAYGSSGTTAQTFSTREGLYNKAIAQLTALGIQLEARPMPSGKALTKVRNKVNEVLRSRGLPEVSDANPSARAIENIIKNLVKMRDTDSKQGLTAVEAEAFKGNIVIFFDQAVTYENFLSK